jgi:hydrogenase nickel incorporation protein HypB
MSSPGSGKTTLLERTIVSIGRDRPVAVIEGDQETLLDAERIRRTGCAVEQVNTGAGCHLDAAMMHDALHKLDPASGSLVFVENVGTWSARRCSTWRGRQGSDHLGDRGAPTSR